MLALLLAARGFRSPGKVLLGATVAAAVAAGAFVIRPPSPSGSAGIALTSAWQMHTIVAGAAGTGQPDGADGVQTGDLNGDGYADLIVGHEQGLRATVSLHPGPYDGEVESAWPTVTLPSTSTGNLCSAEDGILADVDQDGALDVIVACETGAVSVTILYAPTPPNVTNEYLNSDNWTRVDLTASAGTRYMRVALANVAGSSAPEIVVGGKESDGPATAAALGYFSSATPRTGASWTFTSITPVGWVMQMYVIDFNADGDLDIVYSDRDPIDTPSTDNTKRGVRWLDSNGADPPVFTARAITTVESDHKWFDLADWDGDGDLDVADCRSSDVVNALQILLNGGGALSWSALPVTTPSDIGRCQHLVMRDVDSDGALDLALTASNAQSLSSVVWLKRVGSALAPIFSRGEIAGVLSTTSDVKMDNIHWADLDGDTDLDVVVTEQHVPNTNGPGMGVLWFENPLVASAALAGPARVKCSVLTSGSSTTDATSIATASISPTAGRAIYAAIVSSNSSGPNTATITGAGLTWSLENTSIFSTSNARKITVRRGAGTPSAGALTFDFAGQTQTSFAWIVAECSGADPNAPTAQAVTATSGTSSVTTLNANLAALQSSSSRILAFAATNTNSAIGPDTQYLELADVTVANGNATLELATAVNETSVTPTWNSAAGGIVAVEVRIAP